MITQAEAHAYAIDVLRQKMQHPRFDRTKFASSIEGVGGPGIPGWMVRAGVMHVPGHFCGDVYRFSLTDLFAEVDSPQGGLFA